MSETVRDLLERALDAYAALSVLGEDVEDEWTYVTELSEAWRDRLEGVVVARGAGPADEAAAVSVDRVIEEIGGITDPHRAIDWLSTFPQVVLLALRESP